MATVLLLLQFEGNNGRRSKKKERRCATLLGTFLRLELLEDDSGHIMRTLIVALGRLLSAGLFEE